jgi:hypothetical protein
LLTENAEKLYGIVRNGRASAKRFVDYNPVRAILLVFSEMSICYRLKLNWLAVGKSGDLEGDRVLKSVLYFIVLLDAKIDSQRE